MPGGVNSPVRAFNAVGKHPIFMRRGQGAWLESVDEQRYIDFVGSWGPLILGHAHPQVVHAVQEAASNSLTFGTATAQETLLAERIHQAFPSMPMLRLTSSGTEAVMGALRVARGFTKRDLVVKCVGNYHGGADYLLVKAGSGAATLGEPDSAGVPAAIANTTRLIPYNDIDAFNALMQAEGDHIAAIILEPIAGNMGCVPAHPEWLQALRSQSEKHGALLVFDEVMTGFRVAYGGAQSLQQITPDLTCLGKIVGGGMPLAAYGGRAEIMRCVAPDGPVYQAGTLSGNPVAVAAGLKTLELLGQPGVYDTLEQISARVETLLRNHIKEHALAPATLQRVGSMLTLFFHLGPVHNWDQAAACNTRQFAQWHRTLLNAGIYWPPSQYEAAFISLAHEDVLDEVGQRLSLARN